MSTFYARNVKRAPKYKYTLAPPERVPPRPGLDRSTPSTITPVPQQNSYHCQHSNVRLHHPTSPLPQSHVPCDLPYIAHTLRGYYAQGGHTRLDSLARALARRQLRRDGKGPDVALGWFLSL